MEVALDQLPPSRRGNRAVGTESAVAIVVTNHLKVLCESVNKFLGPVRQLATESHDQQKWLAAPRDLVFDIDAVHLYLGHEGTYQR